MPSSVQLRRPKCLGWVSPLRTVLGFDIATHDSLRQLVERSTVFNTPGMRLVTMHGESCYHSSIKHLTHDSLTGKADEVIFGKSSLQSWIAGPHQGQTSITTCVAIAMQVTRVRLMKMLLATMSDSTISKEFLH